MKLSILELNTLYYALGKREIEAEKEYKEFGGDFYRNELDRVKDLIERVSAELNSKLNFDKLVK
jgi:hypothetical protein